MNLKSFVSACVVAWALSSNAQTSDVFKNVDVAPEIVKVLNSEWSDNNVVLPDSVWVDKSEWENNLKGNDRIGFGASIEAQTCLYDNFTFEQYSKKPWIHFLGSVTFPISKNTNISLSESVYYTPEMNNPTCENNVTDLVLSHSFGKFSVDGWFQLSQYLNQKGSDILSVYSMLNYSPNDNLSFCIVPYKPLLLDWKKNSDFYILSKSEYKISDDKEIFMWTMTSCTDNWKTLFWFGFSSSIWNNLSVGFTIIPHDNVKIWVIPKWLQWTLKYEF